MRQTRSILANSILASMLFLAACSSQSSTGNAAPTFAATPTGTSLPTIAPTATPNITMAKDAFKDKKQITLPLKTPSGAAFYPQSVAPDGSFIVGTATIHDQLSQSEFDIVQYAFSTKTFTTLRQLKNQFYPMALTDGRYVAWMNPGTFTGGPSDNTGSEVGYDDLTTGNIVTLASKTQGLVAVPNGEFALTHGKLIWGKIGSTFQEQPLVVTDLASNTTTTLTPSLSTSNTYPIQDDYPYICLDVAQPTQNSYMFINLQTLQQKIVDEPGPTLIADGMLYTANNNAFQVAPNPLSPTSPTSPTSLNIPPYFAINSFQATNGHLFAGMINNTPALWDQDTGQIIGTPNSNEGFLLTGSFLFYGSTQTQLTLVYL